MNVQILVLMLGIFAGNSATDRQIDASKKSLMSVRMSVNKKQTTQTKCTRGAAVPIIKKSIYHKTTFVLQPDSITGIETVTFDNGEKLTIKNWGCEYYVLTFCFETSRFQKDSTNLNYWFKSAAALMTEILSGLEAPIDIKKGINDLIIHVDNDKANNYKNLKLGEEINFGENDIRSFVSVNRIEKLTDKKYAIEITFATGPL